MSRLSGFARDLTVAAFFHRRDTDIFFVAFRLPNFFRRFLSEGAFSASVTPVLTESAQNPPQRLKETKAAFAAMFTWVFLAGSLLSLFGVLFMEEIMSLLFRGKTYSLHPGKLKATILAGKIVFSYLFLSSLYSYFTASAQAFGKFFLPAAAPALLNLLFNCIRFSAENPLAFSRFRTLFGGSFRRGRRRPV